MESALVLIKIIGCGMGFPLATYMLLLERRYRNRIFLYHAIAWYCFIVAVFFEGSKNYHLVSEIAVSLVGFFLVCGLVRILCQINPHNLRYLQYLALIPLLGIFYRILVLVALPNVSMIKKITKNVHIGMTGYVLLLVGFIILKSTRNENFRKLGIGYMTFGMILMVYPFVRETEFALPLFAIGLVTGLSIVHSLYKVLAREKFEFVFPTKRPATMLESGVHLIDSESSLRIMEEFRDFPVLAFIRSFEYPKAWNAYIVSNVQKENAISPTKLEFILELCVRYLKKAKEKNVRGVVYIDCLEYLKMYNSFESLLKFLHSLRDYAIVFNGSVLISINEKAWDEKEIVLLKTIERR